MGFRTWIIFQQFNSSEQNDKKTLGINLKVNYFEMDSELFCPLVYITLLNVCLQTECHQVNVLYAADMCSSVPLLF